MLAEAEIFMKLENPCSEPPVCFGGSSHPVMLHLYVCDQSLFEGFILFSGTLKSGVFCCLGGVLVPKWH